MLARYSGWGAVPQIFEDRDDWAELSQEMNELLDADELAAARASTLNAHYTDPGLARVMWDVMDRAGFDGGVVVEPGCGTGNFLGEAPEQARMVGVELDPMAARVASLLYPGATVRQESYTTTWIPEATVSAAIGNVPFGSYRPFDRADNPDNLAIHNYFINKSMRRLAPGGYGAFVTSTWTMDAKRESARRAIAEHSDLVAAVRLPVGAFSRSAGTEVMTDVLVFRRRPDDEAPDVQALDAWVPAGTAEGELDGDTVTVGTSKYFAQHPEHVLGEQVMAVNRLSGEPALEVHGETGEQLHEQVRTQLGQQVEAAAAAGLAYGPVVRANQEAVTDLAPGGLVVTAGQDRAFIGQVRIAADGTIQQRNRQRAWEVMSQSGHGSSYQERVALIGLKETVREAIDTGAAGADVAPVLQRLHENYDAYVARYGPVNRFTTVAGKKPTKATVQKRLRESQREWAKMTFPELTRAEQKEQKPDEETWNEWVQAANEPEAPSKRQEHLSFLRRDPDFGKLLALESFDEDTGVAEKSGYFQPETFTAGAPVDRADSVQHALAITLNETRRVDLERIAGLLDTDEDTAREQLRGLVFQDPETSTLVPAVSYLAGDVRQKLQAAESAAAADLAFEENVTALRDVLPEWIGLEAMSLRPGMPFISTGLHQQFCEDVFGVSVRMQRAESSERRGWDVKTTGKATIPASVRHRFGTDQANPTWLLGKVMNNQPVTLTMVDENEKRVPDPKATALAREKCQEIIRAFAAWAGSDEKRRQAIEGQYNRMMNSYVAPDYTSLGEGLRLEGLNPAMTPHPYQREAVARILHEPSVLLDHVVGAGKTGSMLMGAMELRRAGVASKPWMVVPNHLVDQMTRESAQWFPNANVLTIPSGVSAEQRRAYAASSAAGDWDLVICPQSVFAKVRVSPGRQRQWLREDIEELEQKKRSSAGDSRFGVKAIEGEIQRLKERLARIDANKDEGVVFEETGCDYLLIDEAHDFKNLRRFSEYQDLQCTGSDKATDLDYMLRALRDMKAGQEQAGPDAGLPAVATFATGTPVANSLAEAWVMGHYLRPDLMDSYGIRSVDEFGTLFTEAKDAVEVEPSGVGFRIVNRVSSFTNMQAMTRLMNAYTGTVTREDLPMQLPEVAEGKMISSTREASPHVKAYVADLVKRANNPTPEDGLLKILGEARKVALDPRMMGLDADPDGGRAQAVATEIMRIHEQTADRQYRDADGNISPVTGGLQLAFCDLGVPGGDGFNFYQALKDELVDAGMDAERIAFIHDYDDDAARGELFAAARAGEVSVLIGSTQRMGTGMNVQDRVTAIHHVDIPWRPADLEQREGRGIRQGNQNESLEVRSYISEGTFDAYMWQVIARKAKFLSQLKSGTGGQTMENIGGLHMSAQEMVIAASGDSRVADWLTMNQRINILETLAAGESSQRSAVRFEADTARSRVEALEKRIEQIGAMRAREPRGDFALVLGGQEFTNRNQAGVKLAAGLKAAAGAAGEDTTAWFGLGTAGALVLQARRSPINDGRTMQIGVQGIDGLEFEINTDSLMDGTVPPVGLSTRVWNMVSKLGPSAAKAESDLQTARQRLTEAADVEEQAEEFSRQEELDDLRVRRDVLAAELNIDQDKNEPGQEERLEGEEFTRVFRVGNPSWRDVRVGDVLEVTDPNGAVSRGMWEVTGTQESVTVKPADSVADGSVAPVELGWAGFEFVSRRFSALSPWERYLAGSTGTEDLLVDMVRQDHRIKPGMKVAAWGQAGEDEEPRMFTGRVTGFDDGRYHATRGPRLTMVETGSDRSVDVHLVLPNSIPSIVLLGAEQEAQQETGPAVDDPDREVSVADLLPGDVVIEGVERVAETGHMKVPGGHWGVVDPQTHEIQLGRYQVGGMLPVGNIRVGRELTDEEVRQLFPEGMGNTVDQLRAGDVLDGQSLDRKRPLAGDVQIRSVSSTGRSLRITYAPVGDPFAKDAEEITKRYGTKTGEVKTRRYGALTQPEKVRLVTGVSMTTPERLDETSVGTFIGTPMGQRGRMPRWVWGRVVSVEAGEAPGFMNVIVDVDGEQRTLRFTDRDKSTKEVLVFDEGWPESGIDFRGVPVGPEAAEAEATQGGQVNVKRLPGFLIDGDRLAATAAQLAQLPLRADEEAETEDAEETAAEAAPEAEATPEPEAARAAAEPETESEALGQSRDAAAAVREEPAEVGEAEAAPEARDEQEPEALPEAEAEAEVDPEAAATAAEVAPAPEAEEADAATEVTPEEPEAETEVVDPEAEATGGAPEADATAEADTATDPAPEESEAGTEAEAEIVAEEDGATDAVAEDPDAEADTEEPEAEEPEPPQMVEVTVEEVQAGDQVQITGEDALTGGSVEATGRLVSVGTNRDDPDARVMVTDEDGVTHHVTTTSAQIEVPAPERREEPVQPGPRNLAVTQLRPGDVARIRGESWQVYGVAPAGAAAMIVTGHRQNAAIVEQTKLPRNTRLPVVSPPTGQDLSAAHDRPVRNVREGDVVQVNGSRYDVLGAVHNREVTELQLFDGVTEPVLHREYGDRTVRTEVPVSPVDAVGVCGPARQKAVETLKPGETIQAKHGQVAVVNGVAQRDGKVQVRFQMLAGPNALEPAALVKNRGDVVMAHQQHHKPAPATREENTAPEQQVPAAEHARHQQSGPSMS